MADASAVRRALRRPYYALRYRGKRTRLLARAAGRRHLRGRIRRWHRTLSFPSFVLMAFLEAEIHPSYGMSWARRVRLALQMKRNTRRIQTGTSYKAHLAMAIKLLEIPPEVEGVVVECGCFLGGSTANLSLVCKIVDRELIVYDSFEGLPAPTDGDKYATDETAGAFRGDLDDVRANVARSGSIDSVEFRKGWFDDTLDAHAEAVVMCFLDVDYQASLTTCVTELWPHLSPTGLMFIDEYTLVDYCALFFSERFWRETFDTTPPGLIGTGTGIGIGEHYFGSPNPPPFSGPGSVAYTAKNLSGHWDYFPEGE